MSHAIPTSLNGNTNDLTTVRPSANVLPAVELYSSHYLRYNGPIGRLGANQTTHTAEVNFPEGPALAVVKAFPLKEKGWVNEALAWALGNALNVGVPPKAMLLAASPSDLAGCKDPELSLANSMWGQSGPIMLWCASRLEIKMPQQVWPVGWERIVTSKPFGRRLAAFDAWLGNCDRIAQNAPYWLAKGRIAAIDHERLAFNQDWRYMVPVHMDKVGGNITYLMEAIRESIAKKKIKSSDAKALIADLSQLSDEHSGALAAVQVSSEQLVMDNFGKIASTCLHAFLADRASRQFIDERLEQLR
nr:MAG TPA: hypothetical protein [Caudoviricetes sp.]